ncbi:MAG TPA: hypothetical protein VFW20_11295 [Candidatus Limnocylindrales bacterium]|nr:hypothetical protein [Candidatus Limnocylindrales bacterium]
MTDQATTNPATTASGRTSTEASPIPTQEGEDYTCSNCGCEFRIRHTGDPTKALSTPQPFTCWCGTEMQREHA